MEHFKEVYNANLANGLGNLVSRILTMSEKYLDAPHTVRRFPFPNRYEEAFARFDIQAAADLVWEKIGELDGYIQESQPFKIVKIDRPGGKVIIGELIERLSAIADLLVPFMPETAASDPSRDQAEQKAGKSLPAEGVITRSSTAHLVATHRTGSLFYAHHRHPYARQSLSVRR
jgi:methionyl-tRNA synthetase